MTLYELTLDAEQKVRTQKSPDIRQWCSKIDPVLEAAGQPVIGSDSVDEITLEEGILYIRVFHLYCGCVQTQQMRLPLDLLQATNPLAAALRYRLEEDLKAAEAGLKNAEQTVKTLTGKVEYLKATLAGRLNR